MTLMLYLQKQNAFSIVHSELKKQSAKMKNAAL